MIPREKKSYFLYGEGRSLDTICLGNLVLRGYSDPTISHHYTHRQLSEEELKHHASSTNFKDRVIHATHRPGYGIQLDGAQLSDLDVSWSASEEVILTAKSGMRVELKDPVDFLNMQVLQSEGQAEESLKLWLSAANSDYMLRMKWLRKPTIWMCTGLYILKDTRIFTVSSRDVRASVGVSAATITALVGVPIGGSVKISPHASLEMGSASDEQLVWAAQYRRLQVKYIRLGDGEEAKLPGSIALYPDVISDGTLRGESEEANAVQITVATETDDGGPEAEGPASEGLYYERLEKAITAFEEEL